MRKLFVLAIIAAPVAALGAYAYAANGDAGTGEGVISVSEPVQGDPAMTTDQANPIFTMGEVGEYENEAGPISSNGLNFDEGGEHESGSDD